MEVHFPDLKIKWYEGEVHKVRNHASYGFQIEVYFVDDNTVSWLTVANEEIRLMCNPTNVEAANDLDSDEDDLLPFTQLQTQLKTALAPL